MSGAVVEAPPRTNAGAAQEARLEKSQPGALPLTLVHVTTVPSSLTFLDGQIGRMLERGLSVHVLSSPGDSLDGFGERYGIPAHAVQMPRSITPFEDLRALLRIRAILRRVRPQIVHAHTPKGGLLGMIGAWLAGVPVRVYHMRGLPMMTATGRRRKLLHFTERLSCSLAHRVLCVSPSLRRVAIEEGICPADKIEVLLGGSGNGVDASGRFDPGRVGTEAGRKVRAEFGIPAEHPVVGFVGRLVRDKGVGELAEAWATIREAHPNAHLLIVGSWGEEDAVQETVRRALEADPRVHLPGSRRDTPELYSAMDLVVLPTYREGFPNVPLEAASMGLPVVATRIPGCIDAVEDGVTGTLVPPRDVPGLAEAIQRYVADVALRRRHGAAGRARVLSHFRQEPIWDAIHGVYSELLTERAVLPVGTIRNV